MFFRDFVPKIHLPRRKSDINRSIIISLILLFTIFINHSLDRETNDHAIPISDRLTKTCKINRTLYWNDIEYCTKTISITYTFMCGVYYLF